jgi:hypothetical protein
LAQSKIQESLDADDSPAAVMYRFNAAAINGAVIDLASDEESNNGPVDRMEANNDLANDGEENNSHDGSDSTYVQENAGS